MRWVRRPEVWVCCILLGSYAYFWQSRDWNSASRLMLTYAIVDRGTVDLDGLEDQTHDRAFLNGHFYSDKLPGFSLLATVPYALLRLGFGFPAHPLGRPGFAYWPADYWVTLATSGLLTALTGSLLYHLALGLGCSARRAALVGLGYGLATPAYAYATLSYGHQATAFALLGGFALLGRSGGKRPGLEVGLAGFLAASAAVIELQAGVVSAVLGFYLLGLVVTGRRRAATLGNFLVGAAIPTLVLLGYNVLAFGSPWDMGYFHHTTKAFADVHSEANPLGLGRPNLALVGPLLWGRHRGLLFYAPMVAVVPIGLGVLGYRRRWGTALVSAAAMVAVLLVNLSYPEWTGGWSTGPRLLVTLLPFAMLPVAAWLGENGRGSLGVVLTLTLAGGVLMLLFVGVGGRVPQFFPDPLIDPVWRLWRGQPVRDWVGTPLARNVVSWMLPETVGRLGPAHRWVQFVPLAAVQVAAIAALSIGLGRKSSSHQGGSPKRKPPSQGG